MLEYEDFTRLDAGSPLSQVRNRFTLPRDIVYMNGNSLGVMPSGVIDRLSTFAYKEWSQGLIRSWNSNDWFTLPSRVGDKIANLIGAESGEVIVADSTSVNLYKLVIAALRYQQPRRKIITDDKNFPTDLYVLQGIADTFVADTELVIVNGAEVTKCIDSDTALVTLTHVNYRTSELYDMDEITQKTQKHGALILWDLSHSCGAMPIDLNGANVDFATGCGYKYLNGGPGAPGFLFVAKRLQQEVTQPITGWMGHSKPFAMSTKYDAAEGIKKFLTGTPSIASMSCLEEGVDSFDGVSLTDVVEVSRKMGDLFIQLVEEQCEKIEITILSPKNNKKRGSHIALKHKHAYAVMQALIDRGIIGDFRAPDVMRFAITPLYLRYKDIWKAIATLKNILETESWNQEKYITMKEVT